MEPEKSLEIIDITQPLNDGMVVYPGDLQVKLERICSLEAGDAYNLTAIQMGAHAGTHLDAPNHYLAGGEEVQEVPLNSLVGPARVLEWGERASIDLPELERREIRAGERLLFKTANSRLYPLREFREDYAFLTPAGARYLRDKEVALVGIDYLSIEEYGIRVAGAHLELLGGGIPILEGLDLSRAVEGTYWLIALPLKLHGAEGAPVRAILIKHPE
jgi:arylformamidase